MAEGAAVHPIEVREGGSRREVTILTFRITIWRARDRIEIERPSGGRVSERIMRGSAT